MKYSQGEPKPLLGHKIYIFGDTGNYKNVLFIGRRCEKQWVRLSSNLLIEQGLMRSGALTIGRGIDESRRTIWSLQMPACVSTNHPMQEFSGVIQKQSRTRTCQKQGKVETWKILQQWLNFLKPEIFLSMMVFFAILQVGFLLMNQSMLTHQKRFW